jgi:hypothetical protein
MTVRARRGGWTVASRPSVRRLPAWSAGLAGLAGLLGASCAHPARGPADTLAGFGAALEKSDYAAAYALMSADYRQRMPLADFRAQLEAAGAEVPAAARRLRQAAPRTPMRIEVEVDLGDKLALVLEDGQWRVAGQPFDPYAQKSPRAALRSFIRALEARRYDVVLRLVPNRYRAGVNADKMRDYWEGARRAENQKLLERLRQNVDAPIVETGDEARMPYGDDFEVKFAREDGLWKISDPD